MKSPQISFKLPILSPAHSGPLAAILVLVYVNRTGAGWEEDAMGRGESHHLDCDICGAKMVEQKCKIRCFNCGFTRDCSDP